MSGMIIDGDNKYPARIDTVTTSNVLATMETADSYKAVTSGDDRAGQAVDNDGNTYDVKLPGLKSGPPLVVAFTRVAATAKASKSA